jgi:hypothetical protein
MPFFNEKDYEKINQSKTDAPDGLINGSHYLQVFKNMIENLDELDPEDFSSKMKFMMDVVNPIYTDDDESINKTYVFDLVTCMSFHVIQLLLVGSTLNSAFKDTYMGFIKDDILPTISSECEGIPYWE